MKLEDFRVINTDPIVMSTSELHGFSLTLIRKDDTNWLARLMFDEAVVVSRNYVSTAEFLDDLNWIGNHIFVMLLYQIKKPAKQNVV